MSDETHPTSRITRRTLAGSIAWAIALAAVLQLHRLNTGWGHAICGPWGCGPPAEALLGYHGFWIVLLWGVGLVFARRAKAPQVARWAKQIFLVTLLALVAVVAVDAVDWVSHAGSYQYLAQRCLFRVATLVDVPLLPLVIVAGGFWWRSALKPL